MKSKIYFFIGFLCLFGKIQAQHDLPAMLKVGTCADNNPFEFYSSDEGHPIAGFDIDLIQAIGKRLSIPTQLSDIHFDGLILAIQSERVDLGIAAINPNDERRKQLDFSQPYCQDQASLLFLKKNSFTDLSQVKSIGVQLGSTYEITTRKRYSDALNIRSYQRVPQLIHDLNNENIEAVVIGNEEAKRIQQFNPHIACKNLDWIDEKAIAFPKNSPWLSKVNQVLQEMESDGTLQALKEKWDLGADSLSLSSAINPSLLKFNWVFFLQNIPFLWQGFLVTLKYVFCALVVGLILGILLVIGNLSPLRPLRWGARFYISIFRGTPLLLQLGIVYYALPSLTSIKLSAFEAGIISFGLNSGAYISEILRSGFNGINKGQWEAAKILGLSKFRLWKDIIFPQAIRNSLPALANEVIDLLKESALISVLGEADLLCRANQIASEHYLFLEPLALAGLFYYITVMLLSGLVKTLERRLQIYAAH